MRVALKVGAEIDVLTQDELRAELTTFAALLRKIVGSRPRVRTLEAGGVAVPASGTLDIDIGQPPLGMAWDVRRINVTGQDPTAALAGVATIYRGEAGTPLGFVDRSTTALPSVSPWNAWQFTLRQEESFIVRITGGTAGQVPFVTAQVIELPYGEVFAAVSEA